MRHIVIVYMKVQILSLWNVLTTNLHVRSTLAGAQRRLVYHYRGLCKPIIVGVADHHRQNWPSCAQILSLWRDFCHGREILVVRWISEQLSYEALDSWSSDGPRIISLVTLRYLEFMMRNLMVPFFLPCACKRKGLKINFDLVAKKERVSHTFLN